MENTYFEVGKCVDEWLSLCDDQFTTRDIWYQYNIKTREAKHYLTRILQKKIDDGQLIKIGKEYRVVDREIQEMDWQGASDESMPILWPMEIHQWIRVYPCSTIVVAGSPGTGKTAFLYEFLLRNQTTYANKMVLFTNDMGAEEMKQRFANFEELYNIKVPSPPPWKTFPRFDRFEDVVWPDGINVIDYLKVTDSFWLVGKQIDAIQKKLKTGIAVIGIQKKEGQEVGIGGVHGTMTPKTYFKLDKISPYSNEAEQGKYSARLTIQKARGGRDESINPVGMSWRYSLVKGAKFRYMKNGHGT